MKLSFSFLSFWLLTLVLPAVVGAAPVPILKIDEPTDGQVIESYVVNLNFSLKNFTLKDYHTTLKNNPNQGHLLIWLDRDERNLENAVRYYKDSPYIMADVLPGKHTLVVELANNDGSSFDPGISQTIKFETKATPGSEAAPLKTSDQPKVSQSQAGEVPKLSEVKATSNFLPYLVIGLALLFLGILGLVYLKRSPTLPPPPPDLKV